MRATNKDRSRMMDDSPAFGVAVYELERVEEGMAHYHMVANIPTVEEARGWLAGGNLEDIRYVIPRRTDDGWRYKVHTIPRKER